MGKILGYIAVAGVIWVTYKAVKKAKEEKKPKIK
jgi:hypothetical protein